LGRNARVGSSPAARIAIGVKSRKIRILRADLAIRASKREMGPLNDADEALAQRSRRGDREAFEELVRRTSRGLFARLYLETADPHKAEDIAQEAYLLAWRSIRSLSEAGAFRAWLFSIAHSVMLQNIRRESRTKRVGSNDQMEAVSDARPGPAEAAGSRERREKILALLRSMPGEYRLALTMRYLGGADYETIGRELAISNGSLRGLLNRGMAMLRAQINDRTWNNRSEAL
jgi:RNA polymerase sigma-70 factor, ECF subfamily